MDEIRALQKKLFEVQQGKSVNRLNDSNVIELVTKLIEAGLVELIISGQGYLTPKQLEIEIKDEVLVHGGRVALTELQSTIGADSSIVDDAAGRLVAASPRSLALVQGELIADYFLDDVAAEVNQELQEVGQIAMSKIASRYNFTAEFLTNQMQHRLGTLIDGKMEQGGILYTSAYIERHRAKMRGIFSAVTTPGSVADMTNTFGLQDSLFAKQLNELIKCGRVKGSYQRGRGQYTPSVNSMAQEQALETFYRQNGFIDYSMISDLGIKTPAKYAKQRFSDGIALETCHSNRQLLERLEADCEAAADSALWLDVRSITPVQFTDADVSSLIEQCEAVDRGNLMALEAAGCESLLVSKPMLISCQSRFDQAAAQVVAKAAAAGKLSGAEKPGNATPSLKSSGAPRTKVARGGGGQKGGGKSIAAQQNDDDDDDEDWVNEGKRSKGKKGKGKKGRGGGGAEPHAGLEPTGSKKGKAGKNKGGVGGGDEGVQTAQTAAAALAPSKESMAEEIGTWYEDLAEAYADAIAETIRPAVLKTYSEAQRSAFASAARARKLSHERFVDKFIMLQENFQLFVKGAQSVEDNALRSHLEAHVLREHATELVALLLGSQAMHAGVKIPGQAALARTESDPGLITIPSELRTAAGRELVIGQLPSDVGKSLGALGSALGGRDLARFTSVLDASCEVCGMRTCGALDKKKEKQLVFQHRQQLMGALAEEMQPLKALRLGAQLTAIAQHAIVLDVPNKAIPSLVAYLVARADGDEAPTPTSATGALDAYHSEAREYLILVKNAASGDAAAEAAAQTKRVILEEGLSAFKQMLTRSKT